MSIRPPAIPPSLTGVANHRGPGSRLRTAFRTCLWMAGMMGLSLMRCLGQEVEPAADLDNRLDALRALSLEEVLNTEVTTLGKRPEPLFAAPGAVFLITNEELRRSGARNVAEALRLAPGLSVASIDANKWAITGRGFNQRFADKLLVLVDGRTVYSPDFNGVFWDRVSYPMEDIERVEVIRGPGGAVWGANAVNGVINIITKSSHDTTGAYVTGGAGTEDPGFGEARYGWRFNSETSARAYVSYGNHDNYVGNQDDWDMVQGGFRTDWQNEHNSFTVQGDYHYSQLNGDILLGRLYPVPGTTPPSYIERYPDQFYDRGGNVLARFTHIPNDESQIQLQAYYDHTDRSELVLDAKRDTVDVDFQHRFLLPWRQSFMYGLGYRYLPDQFRNPDPSVILWDPAERHWQVFSTFVQDEIRLVPDQLTLTLGSKFEHNDATGWEVQPDARLAWQPTARQTLWAAVSRAVQVPGRNFDAVKRAQLAYEPITNGVPLPLFVVGRSSEDLPSLEVLAYELGYRIQVSDSVSLDAALFYNDYRGITVGRLAGVDFVGLPYPHLETASAADKSGTGTSWGGELTAEWRASDWCRFSLAYSYFRPEPEAASSGRNTFVAGTDPENQVSLRASFDLPGRIQLDLWGRFVDDLPALGVEAYGDFDVRLAWRPRNWIEVAVVGQNLIAPQRLEFVTDPAGGSGPAVPTQVPRGAYFQVSLRF